MATLAHRELAYDPTAVAVNLPLGDELGPLGTGAGFPLLLDPRTTGLTSIIGMFVLRPARQAWTAPVLDNGQFASAYTVADWCFNVRGVDGGWLIAGGNPFDAYRLALQYGLSDAVIVGSNTVCTEGVDHAGHDGYVWQPYGPAAWPQLAALDADIGARIARQRSVWQQLGVLSSRTWPAQIVVTQSGEVRAGGADLLDARIFHATHPDGSEIESYVLTSATGAGHIRARALARGMDAAAADRLLLVASPPGQPDQLDIAAVPQLLRSRLDIRIANHDGGRTVLSTFSQAGVLAQMNLTLMRGTAVAEVLAASTTLPDRERLLAEFDSRRQLFFSGDHRLPAALRCVSVLADDADAVVCTFDARNLRGL